MEIGMLSPDFPRIFTADRKLILHRVGRLGSTRIGELVEAVVRILRDEGS